MLTMRVMREMDRTSVRTTHTQISYIYVVMTSFQLYVLVACVFAYLLLTWAISVAFYFICSNLFFALYMCVSFFSLSSFSLSLSFSFSLILCCLFFPLLCNTLEEFPLCLNIKLCLIFCPALTLCWLLHVCVCRCVCMCVNRSVTL